MPSTIETLRAIGGTEPKPFNQFLNALPDRPERGERSAWAELFDTLDALENMELIDIKRGGQSNRIDFLQLTEVGAERVRESNEEAQVVRPKPRAREIIRRPFN